MERYFNSQFVIFMLLYILSFLLWWRVWYNITNAHFWCRQPYGAHPLAQQQKESWGSSCGCVFACVCWCVCTYYIIVQWCNAAPLTRSRLKAELCLMCLFTWIQRNSPHQSVWPSVTNMGSVQFKFNHLARLRCYLLLWGESEWIISYYPLFVNWYSRSGHLMLSRLPLELSNSMCVPSNDCSEVTVLCWHSWVFREANN